MRAGIVGCGRIGSLFDDDPKRKFVATHAGAYTAVDGVELMAACDMDKEKLVKCGEKWHIPSLYQDYRDMLRKEAIDILSICTWNSTHLDILKEAVNNGVQAIFCEKPIADSLKKADEMIKLCNENSVVLQIDHKRRFDRFHQEIRDFLQSGGLGRIQQITFYYVSGIASAGSHMFDLLRFFFGDIDWIQAVYSQNDSHNPDDPNIDGMLGFKNGTHCSFQAGDAQDFYIFEMDCIGTKGRLNITRDGFDLDFFEVRPSQLFSEDMDLFQARAPISIDVPREFMVAAVRHLMECLTEGKKSISSGEDGRAALELICACHESARAGGKRVTLPLKDSEIVIKSR